VDDAAVVHCLQAGGDLRRDLAGPHRRHRPVAQHPAERRSAQQLHHQIRAAVIEYAEVRDIHRVRVADLRGQLGLLQEAQLRHLILLLEQDLDRDRGVQQHVAGLVDHAHAAAAQAVQHQVAIPQDGAEDRVGVGGDLGVAGAAFTARWADGVGQRACAARVSLAVMVSATALRAPLGQRSP
jgi:hypothetical protein